MSIAQIDISISELKSLTRSFPIANDEFSCNLGLNLENSLLKQILKDYDKFSVLISSLAPKSFRIYFTKSIISVYTYEIYLLFGNNILFSLKIELKARFFQ